MHVTPRKHILYHHGFRKAMACAWINPEKPQNFVLLCGVIFYVTPTQPFWPLRGVYYHKLFVVLNKKIEFDANKQLIYV